MSYELKSLAQFIHDLRLVAAGNVEEAGWSRRGGICFALDYYDVNDDMVEDLYKQWPEYSGNDWYPVPADPDRMNGRVLEEDPRYGPDSAPLVYVGALKRVPYVAETAERLCFMEASDKYSGTYGAARRRLAGWLADQLEAAMVAAAIELDAMRGGV